MSVLDTAKRYAVVNLFLCRCDWVSCWPTRPVVHPVGALHPGPPGSPSKAHQQSGLTTAYLCFSQPCKTLILRVLTLPTDSRIWLQGSAFCAGACKAGDGGAGLFLRGPVASSSPITIDALCLVTIMQKKIHSETRGRKAKPIRHYSLTSIVVAIPGAHRSCTLQRLTVTQGALQGESARQSAKRNTRFIF